MPGLLIHINGAPGVGKLTIARHLARRLRARVLDNHAIYNVAFALTDFRSPRFYEAVRAVRRTAYAQILAQDASETVILTDAYFEDSDWARESWDAIEALAAQRGSTFLTIALHCDAREHRKRIASADRDGKGKIRDQAYVDSVLSRRLIERRTGAHLKLDVTTLGAAEAAARIADWIARRDGPGPATAP